MINHLKRTLGFYVGWRLPFVVAAVALAIVGLATDSWWSPLVAVSGLVPLLALLALTATRVGAQEEKLAAHAVRLTASETRLAHAEDRSVANENRFDAIDKKLKRLETAVAAKPTQMPVARKREKRLRLQIPMSSLDS